MATGLDGSKNTSPGAFESTRTHTVWARTFVPGAFTRGGTSVCMLAPSDRYRPSRDPSDTRCGTRRIAQTARLSAWIVPYPP